jgi:methyl-accepting chemotaxis protein
MPTQKRSTSKKSTRASSKKSKPHGESIRVSELLEALQRINQGRPIRAPRDAHPDVVKVFSELGNLAERRISAEQPSSVTPIVAKPITNWAEANGRIGDLADRVCGASDALANVCSLVNGLPSVEETQANANELDRIVTECLEHCESGLEAVLRTISDIYRTRESTQEAVSVISNLGFRLEAMKEICATISNLSHELKVIGVNAQILVAQSGKHGPAFRFVAEKVEEIGKGIEGNVRDIEQLISTIGGESHGALGLVERGAHSVDPGVEQANTAERALKHIVDRCTQLQGLSRGPTNAIMSWKQATEGLRRVALAMNSISVETEALATWTSNTHSMAEQTRNELMGHAIEQWALTGERLLDFAKRMEQATSAREQTFHRLGEVLDKLDRAPRVKSGHRK